MTYDAKLYKAMDEYFLYKNNIELRRAASKNKIIKNDQLDKDQKANMIASLNQKCINCKRDVGTAFSENERTFKIVCGDVSKPCNLNIEFILGKKEHYDDIIHSASETVNELKERIIHLKAELIYGYKDESEIKDEFIAIKDEYNNFQNIFESIINRKRKLMNATSAQIEPLHQLLNDRIVIIKKNTQSYLESNDPIHISNSIKLYNTEIKEILADIKSKKYANNYIKRDGKEPKEFFYLIQETTRLNDLYISLFKEDVSKLISHRS